MILRNWTRSLKCWEKTIKTLSLQLQPRQCRPGCFGNIRRWQGRTYAGRHHKFGQRQNACPNSPVYQRYAAKLAQKLAKRYGHLDSVVCWHINNEYSGECYCENCEKAFRVWLRKKYGTLKALNEAWNTEFLGAHPL